MKQCNTCKQYKPESDFYWKDKNHIKLNGKCKLCSNKRMTQLRRERFDKVSAYKAEKGCAICGDKRAWVLDLHHRDSDDKDRGISQMIAKNITWDKIQAEMDKCDVLCANCHRDYHYQHK